MHHIRYFLAVSETLNLTRAAERCNVAQPSLTRAIKALETEFGGELLRRERALSHLTELGRRILPLLRESHEKALAAKTVAASIRKGEGERLSVAISHTVEIRLFTPILQKLLQNCPGLQLTLRRSSAAEITEYLKLGAVELAIAGPLSETWSRLDSLPLFEEPFDLVVCPTHRLAHQDIAEFKELACETLLINDGCEMVEALKARLAAIGILDRAPHQMATQEDLLALLKADLGVAIIPAGAAEANGLCRIAVKDLNLMRRVSAYTVAGRHRASACAALFDMLRAADWSFAHGRGAKDKCLSMADREKLARGGDHSGNALNLLPRRVSA